MRTHPNPSQFTNFYISPEDVAKLTPEEILLIAEAHRASGRWQEIRLTKAENIGLILILDCL